MTDLRIPRFSLALLLLLCTAWHGAAQSGPRVSFRIADRDPASRTTLPSGEPLYLRIEYESSVPVRFDCEGYSAGTAMPDMSNPKPVYPAGKGEGLCWIAFRTAAAIDEIRVTAHDAGWNEIGTLTDAIDASWSGTGSRNRRHAAGWAERLSNDQQQQMTAAAASANGDNAGGDVALTLMALSIPGYLLLQGYMLLRFRRGWRLAAMVPLILTIPVGLFTLLGAVSGANLWPLAALFLTPLAFAYLALLGAIRFVVPQSAISRASEPYP